ncbi:hypothetical protein JOM56_005127 [Amanita muscaria]
MLPSSTSSGDNLAGNQHRRQSAPAHHPSIHPASLQRPNKHNAMTGIVSQSAVKPNNIAGGGRTLSPQSLQQSSRSGVPSTMIGPTSTVYQQAYSANHELDNGLYQQWRDSYANQSQHFAGLQYGHSSVGDNQPTQFTFSQPSYSSAHSTEAYVERNANRNQPSNAVNYTFISYNPNGQASSHTNSASSNPLQRDAAATVPTSHPQTTVYPQIQHGEANHQHTQFSTLSHAQDFGTAIPNGVNVTFTPLDTTSSPTAGSNVSPLSGTFVPSSPEQVYQRDRLVSPQTDSPTNSFTPSRIRVQSSGRTATASEATTSPTKRKRPNPKKDSKKTTYEVIVSDSSEEESDAGGIIVGCGGLSKVSRPGKGLKT